MTGLADPAGPLPGAAGRPTAPSAARGLRRRWAIEDHPRIVAFATTPLGRAALLAAFALVLIGSRGTYRAAPLWPMVLVGFAAICAYRPRYRGPALLAATTAVTLEQVWFRREGLALVMRQEALDAALPEGLVIHTALLALFVGSAWMLAWVRRHPASFLARRPVLALLALEAVLCAAAAAPLLDGGARVAAWAALTVFTAYLWFLAYAIVDQRSRDPASTTFVLGTFHPFWGSSTTPLGKGAAFLRRVQARTPDELAVTQIKGLKLLVWSVVLTVAYRGGSWLIEQRLGVPRLEAVQLTFARGAPWPAPIAWASLVSAVAAAALTLAIWGHQAVAIARLAGFRLPRNTWRPLESRTLAEFWNRYYFYFKELLVEFFFVPTFLRAFKSHPRLRMFFATFMAAGLGNAVYHFVRDIDVIATHGLQAALQSYMSYLFYCVVLATGIGLSQARATAGRPRPAGAWGAVRGFATVWSFVVCLHVFGNENREFPLGQRLRFMASLFGVG